MAVLEGPDAGRGLILPARCLVGRSRAADLVLAEPNVSGQHAVIEWAEDRWVVLDLGSRNGTFVEDVRVAVGERVPLGRGAEVRFGRESPRWRLRDDGPPALVGRELASGEQRLGDGGCLVLPGPQAPECSIYQERGGGWVVERDGECAAIEDRGLVTLASGAVWRIHLPTAIGATLQDEQAPPTVAGLRLRFSHSRDEEYVELVALHGERRLDLQARAHHYPLLLLARRRLADQEGGVAAADQGWIRQDELLRMLRMDASHLHIAIHRARTQLGQLGVADAAALVERRAGTRQLRIGTGALEVAVIEGAGR